MSKDRDDALDALIDETARELTAAVPPATLRHSVRERLTPRGPWWRRPLWQPALGVAAVALLIVVVVRVAPGLLREPRPTEAGLVREARPPAVESAAVTTAPPAMAFRGVQARPRAAAPPAGRREDAERGDPVAPLADALEPIGRLEIAPVPIDAIEPAALATLERIPDLMPLRIDRLEIERIALE